MKAPNSPANPRDREHEIPRLERDDILYEDGRLAAIAKPAGLATIPGRGETDSVFEQLARLLNLPHAGSADPRLRVVHRLDKDTSGVLLFAKDIDAQRHLSHQFQNNTTEKEYLALATGEAPFDEGEIDAPIGPHPTARERMMVTRHGRPAVTRWKILERFRGLWLLRVFPKTGKTHQIRVHLRYADMPLAIDPVYNPIAAGQRPGLMLSDFKRGYRAKSDRPEQPLIARLTLHAEILRVEAPGGDKLELTCPLPKDFRTALNALRKYAAR